MELIGSIIIAGGAILAAVIQTYRVGKFKKQSLSKNDDVVIERKVRVFDSPSGYNQDFYDYFVKVIKNAKNNIYITGDGFSNLSSVESKEIAKSYVNAFTSALRVNTNLHVVRLQTKAQSDPEWFKMTARMIDEFGDRFEFYVLPDGKSDQISSVCTIDPKDKQNCISEIMLSRETLRGTESIDLAGTAFFIEGKEALAENLTTRILKLTRVSKRFRSGDELLNTLIGDHYYFAYGSNMDTDQMKDRSPSAEKVGIGILKNYSLVFNRKGTYRKGGVASVEDSKDNNVYGVIWKLNSEDLLKLDITEDPNAYERELYSVYTMDGKVHNCYVYVAFPQGDIKPDPEYLDKIINAAISAELPSSYIEYLKGFKE